MNTKSNRSRSIFQLLSGKEKASKLKLEELEVKTKNIAWYPSAGLDFRDILELSNTNFTEETPDLFIYTDYKPDWSLENRNFETFPTGAIQNDFDNDCKANIDGVFELELTVEVNYFINAKYVDFPNDAPVTPKVFLLDVSVNQGEITITKPVLYFVFENINFLEEILLKYNIKISHFVKVREGCGFGGNKKSISIVYAFMAKLGIKYLFVDNEEHTDFQLIDKIRRRNRIGNISSDIQYVNSIENWSNMLVNIYKVIDDNNLKSLLLKIKQQEIEIN